MSHTVLWAVLFYEPYCSINPTVLWDLLFYELFLWFLLFNEKMIGLTWLKVWRVLCLGWYCAARESQLESSNKSWTWSSPSLSVGERTRGVVSGRGWPPNIVTVRCPCVVSGWRWSPNIFSFRCQAWQPLHSLCHYCRDHTEMSGGWEDLPSCSLQRTGYGWADTLS